MDVASLIDRLYRTYLRPPDAQEAKTRLLADLPADDVTFAIGEFAVPEDQNLLRIESLLEIGQELMAVTGYDASTRTVTVVRGQEGTTAADHTQGASVLLDPSYSRASVFEAIADNIITLHPKLFSVKVAFLSSVAPGVYPCEDELAIGVLRAWPDNNADIDVMTRVEDFNHNTNGRAFITNIGGMGTLWVRYKRRMCAPTSEADDLEDLGVDPRWATMIIVGAAADLLVGRDIPQVQTDWIAASFESEVVRPGTRAGIAGRLAAYRDLLLDRFRQELATEYSRTRRKVRHNRLVT